MSTKDPAAPGLKERAVQEFKDYLIISLYLAFFFCALVAYTNLLMSKYDVTPLNYTFGIFNALVIGKVICVGEMVNVAKHAEARPVYQSVLIKAVIFSLLVLAFHFVEEFVKRVIRGEPYGTVWHHLNPDQLIARSIIIFSTFIPLFAFMELRRVMGEEEFYALFVKRADNPGLSAN
ncbi:hypothetical protein [Edaphobacter bradus]|uniref:hypothetical protein n=1 Tax=Edaphobacter bradus TaxID=2259016 RepID=UPI0021E0224D|nr:hypothetical protein [Edaphobacter bradus]